MNYKGLIQEKAWIIAAIILVLGILTLNSFYFISSTAQNIYYGIYIILSIATIIILHRNYSTRIHHGYLILINLLLIYVVFMDHFIGLPLLLLYPFFCYDKSHWVFKIFCVLTYILLIGVVLLILFVRLFFTTTTIVNEVDSPNNKQMIVVYSIDEGALGGATNIKIANKYLNIFKKEKSLYIGGYGEGEAVQWIDDVKVKIDNRVIDITDY